jgi:PAS domain-containing protein
MATSQRPIEMILARNLLSSVATAACLVDPQADIIFFNEAAGEMLGKRFEETGRLKVEEWTSMFGPFDASGEAIPFEDVALTQALRGSRPAHSSFFLRSSKGMHHHVAASGFPIVGANGFHGSIIVFWPVEDGG